MRSSQYFTVESAGEVSVLRLIDWMNAGRPRIGGLADAFDAFIEKYHPRRVWIDFCNVTWCSSEIIQALIRARKELLDRGASLMLCQMEASVRHVFRTLNLDGTVFDIVDDGPPSLVA